MDDGRWRDRPFSYALTTDVYRPSGLIFLVKNSHLCYQYRQYLPVSTRTLHFTLSERHPFGLCTSRHPIIPDLSPISTTTLSTHIKSQFTQSLTYHSTFQPTIMDDFQTKALAVATSISSYQTPAEALAQSLTNDAPKIDTAIKSYVALTSARVLSANSRSSVANDAAAPTGDDLDQGPICQSSGYHCYFSKSKNPQLASLFCAKVMLQKLNSFKIPMDDHDDAIIHHKTPLEPEEKDEMNEIEFQVVRILWNGLVSHGKKPSKILGLEALYHVYPLLLQTLKENVPANVDLQEGQMFMMEFGSLTQRAMNRRRRKSTFSTTNQKQDNDDNVEDDSCLVWDKDGGKEELRRRRAKREQNAIFHKVQQERSDRNQEAQLESVLEEDDKIDSHEEL